MNKTAHNGLHIALALLSIILTVAVVRLQGRVNRTRLDIQFARELVSEFDYDRVLALRDNGREATHCLYKLQVPEGTPEFRNLVADFVERERKRAVSDIISQLRRLTGKDYGNNPEKWIEALQREGE